MRHFILILLAIVCLWLAGFAYFIYYTKQYPIDNSTVTDAIVVITGGKSRVKTGVNLLKAGYAPILFISGVDPQNQLKDFLVQNGINLDQVIYGGNVASTKENAQEIGQFVINYNLKSIRLVTSYYHMPRAYAEVARLLPTKVTIIPHVVLIEEMDYFLTFKQYNKYLLSVIIDMI